MDAFAARRMCSAAGSYGPPPLDAMAATLRTLLDLTGRAAEDSGDFETADQIGRAAGKTHRAIDRVEGNEVDDARASPFTGSPSKAVRVFTHGSKAARLSTSTQVPKEFDAYRSNFTDSRISTFSGTKAGGVRGLGGNPNPGSNLNNLGSISLSTTPNIYNTSFTLQVTFTAPQGISGSNQATFTATVTGTVRSDNQGGVIFDFNNTPQVFTFTDPNCEPDPTGGVAGQHTTCGSGSFSFSVNDLALDPGQTASITGQITGAQQTTATPTPEPATMFLLGTGLVGVASRVRRRRSRGAE